MYFKYILSMCHKMTLINFSQKNIKYTYFILKTSLFFVVLINVHNLKHTYFLLTTKISMF
jgi:hypothetical protein